jgi:hypothetical protein
VQNRKFILYNFTELEIRTVCRKDDLHEPEVEEQTELVKKDD